MQTKNKSKSRLGGSLGFGKKQILCYKLENFYLNLQGKCECLNINSKQSIKNQAGAAPFRIPHICLPKVQKIAQSGHTGRSPLPYRTLHAELI